MTSWMTSEAQSSDEFESEIVLAKVASVLIYSD